MIKKLVNRLFERRHFWRDIGFDELSELYVAAMFRGLSISLTGIFAPVYLYRQGVSITGILLLMAVFFTARIGMDIVAGRIVARIGPKHTFLIGFGINIVSSVLFLTLQNIHWPLIMLGAIWGTSYSFYFVPFNVDFSKIKHSKHGGKEISYSEIMSKVGATLGPIVGGMVATFFGAQYIFLLSVFVLILGALPLLSTPEPVTTRQKLNYSGLPLSRMYRDLFSYAAFGIENTICINLWPLYLAVFVLVTPDVYLKLGLLATLVTGISIIAAKLFGELADQSQARRILRVSAILNGILHVIRPFVSNYFAALGVGFANEIITPGYRMPYLKGMFDAADSFPGFRIVYISVMESFTSMHKATVWWFLVILSTLVSGKKPFAIGFSIAAIASLLIIIEGYRALNRRGHSYA